MKHHLLWTIAIFFIASTALSCLIGQKKPSPNIVIIFADDLGYGDLGCYGHPTISTPHLDKMASEGLKFTQFYMGASVCTPSRAALLTGRLPIRYGLVEDRLRVFFPFSESGLPAEELTLAEALKEKGYSTAIIGKWHLGHREEFLPLQHGFDEYFGIPYSNDMTPVGAQWEVAKKYPPLPLIEGNKIIESEPDQRLLTSRYTDKCKDFIRRHRDRPFFLYMSHNFPHVPLYASEKFAGQSSRGLYGDVVEEIDWSVGEILHELKQQGLDKNTLVIFTSDNGPWLTMGLEGGSAGLLKQGKGSTWEGGMRVPAIAWWPDYIPAGKTTSSLATSMDLFATALALAGINSQDLLLDGMDIRDILFGDGSPRNSVYFYLGEQLFAYREGPWKIHFKTLNPYVGEGAVVHDPPLLYNLEEDPGERYNVYDSFPEIAAAMTEEAMEHSKSFTPPPSRLTLIDRSMVPAAWFEHED